MMPFGEFKQKIHMALAEYHKNTTHLDVVTDYKQSNDLKMLTRQYLELSKVLYPDRLDAKQQRSILRKYVTLYIDKFKEQKKLSGSSAAHKDIVLLSSDIQGESKAIEGFQALKKSRLNTAKNNKSAKGKNAKEQDNMSTVVNIQLLVDVSND